MPPDSAPSNPNFYPPPVFEEERGSGAVESNLGTPFLTQAGFQISNTKLSAHTKRIFTFPYFSILFFMFSSFTYALVLSGLQPIRLMLIIPGFAFAIILFSAFTKKRVLLWCRPHATLFFLFLSVVTLSCMTSVNRGMSFGTFQHFIKIFLLFILVVNGIIYPAQLHILGIMMGICLGAPALMSIHWWMQGHTMAGRAIWMGVFGDPNNLAGVIIMFLPFQVYGFFRGRIPFQRLIFGGLISISMVAIALTGSRGGLLALVLLIIYFGFKINKERIVIPFLLIGAILYVAAGPEVITSRWNDPTVSTGTGRTQIWKNAFRIFLHNPVIGVGIGAFYHANLIYKDEKTDWLTASKDSHNTWLTILVETGLLGFGLFWAAFYRSIKDLNLTQKRMIYLYDNYGDQMSEDEKELVSWFDGYAFTLQLNFIGCFLAGMTANYAYWIFHYIGFFLFIALHNMERGFFVDSEEMYGEGEVEGLPEQQPASAGGAGSEVFPGKQAHPNGGKGILDRDQLIQRSADRLAKKVLATQEKQMKRRWR